MAKQNCWEFLKCGREPGGKNIYQHGICPAATIGELDGVHSGKKGGRACWAISGTLCNNTIQGSYQSKIQACQKCSFFQHVCEEETPAQMLDINELQVIINKHSSVPDTAEEQKRYPHKTTLTILVADNNTVDRELISNHLRALGHTVIEVANGSEVQPKIQECWPDIVTLSVTLPECDGFQVCTSIRQSGDLLPVIFITNHDSLHNREKAFNLGANDLISKQSGDLAADVQVAIETIFAYKAKMLNLKMTVLVTGVEATTLPTVISCLEMHWLEILSVNSMEDINTIIQQEIPLNLIVSGTYNDDVDGAELCRFLRQQPHLQGTPIIMLCPEAEKDRTFSFFNAGATSYILTPFPRHELHASLVSHLTIQTILKEESREAYRNKLVLNSVVEGVIGIDLNGIVTFANPSACRMLGWEESEIIGRALHTLAHYQTEDEQPYEQCQCPIVKSCKNKELIHVQDDVFYRSDGSVLPIKYSCTPIEQDDDHTGTVITFSDITIEKRDEALRKDVEMITRHDLKAPLSGIIGLPGLLECDDNLTEKQREFLGLIKDSGYRMLNMINQSLNLYKMEKGTYDFNPARIDLLPILHNAISDIQQAHANNLEFSLTVDNERPADEQELFIQGEELLSYSLFANLIKNACEASPAHSTIAISIATDKPDAVVKITNYGTVPESMQESFFEKYSTAEKSGGTGLGTYSARLMTETQKGTISMESSSATGTTLTVRLPLYSHD